VLWPNGHPSGWPFCKTKYPKPLSTFNYCFLRLKAACNKLREALSDRDTSFYPLRAITDGCNKALPCERQQEAAMINEAACAACDKAMATNSLNSNDFLWMRVMTHECTCPDYWLYGACKHVFWAAMLSMGQSPPANLYPRPFASRHRADRPRRAGRALQPMENGQEPMICFNRLAIPTVIANGMMNEMMDRYQYFSRQRQ
jgi:hypothetical protein